jgi:hypothetical protein
VLLIFTRVEGYDGCCSRHKIRIIMNRAKGRNVCSQRLPGGMRHSTRAGREIKRALRFDDHGQTCVADRPVLIHSMDCKGGIL